MAQKIQAIVIKSNDRKEKDKNILLFSIENGKFWATLKGVKGANAKMKLAQNAFCFGEFILEDGKFGKIVVGVEILETFHEISENVDKFFEASAMLEILNSLEFSSETERAQIFVLILKALKTICFSETKQLYVLDKFMLEIFKIYGVPINAEKCSCCGTKSFERIFFDFLSGGLVCISCKGFDSQEVSPTTFSALKIFNNTEFSKLSTIKLADESEFALLKILVKNFEARFDKRLNMVGILS